MLIETKTFERGVNLQMRKLLRARILGIIYDRREAKVYK